MSLVAITGSIGAGKSEFTRLLTAALRTESIDTDRCARELLEGNPGVAAEIRAAFGAGVFDAGGRINRAALRDAAFADERGKQTLEGILHPRIRVEWTQWARERSGPGVILLVEIPLLYETETAALFDCSIVVGCSRATQLRRLAGARGLSNDLAERIIASQWPIEQKIQRGDRVIWNDGSRAALEAQTALCARQLTNQFSRFP